MPATLKVTFFVYHANKYNRDGVKVGVQAVNVDAYRYLKSGPEQYAWQRVGGGQTDEGGMYTFDIAIMGEYAEGYIGQQEGWIFEFAKNSFNPYQHEGSYIWGQIYDEEIALIEPGWEGKQELPDPTITPEPDKPQPLFALPFSTKDLFMLGIMVAFGALVKSLKK